MSIYIDHPRPRKYGVLKCHMIASTLEELHSMAKFLGISEGEFKNHPNFPHYELDLQKHMAAMGAGARLVCSNKLMQILRTTQDESLRKA